MMLVYTYASRSSLESHGADPVRGCMPFGPRIWTFVSRAVFQGASSLVAEMPLVTKTPTPES